ncbi:hypothetical protein [Streptomyces rimosus]|uniref:hypothetical protein n=1 Tax=Streptomyces rimosus TaxID=1927 RepID=UPI000ABDF4AE|nr:hypothetical protein [Streptomyces rimosus]
MDLDRLRGDLGMERSRLFERLCVHLFPAVLAAEFGPIEDGTSHALRPPDGGLEACTRLADGRLVGVQAKYHASVASALRDVDRSVEATLTQHPDLSVLLIFVPQDFTAGGRGKQHDMKRWETAKTRWNALVARHRSTPMTFYAYTKSDIERIAIKHAPEVIPAYFDAGFARLTDIHRHSSSAAESACRRPKLQDPTPTLRTGLSRILEEVDDPRPAAVRMTKAAQELRLWADWLPATQGLLAGTAAKVALAGQRWADSRKTRAACAIKLDATACLLEDEAFADSCQLRREIIETLNEAGVLVGEILQFHDEVLTALRESGPSETMTVRHRGAAGRLVAALADLLNCARILSDLCGDPALGARATGALLIGGGWGTGKSYGLGSWVEARIAKGAPTALVCGHEFDSNTAWDDQLPRRAAPGTHDHSVRDLLAALEMNALITGHCAVLAIDALNEIRSLRGDKRTAFASLAALVQEYPLVRLIATTRMDTRPPAPEYAIDLVRDRPYGFLWNAGVEDPHTAWRIYQDIYGLPPLLLPPDTSELRRPLLMAVLAHCLHRTPAPERGPIAVPTIGELFETWLRTLNADYAAHLGMGEELTAPPLITRACELLGQALGEHESLAYRSACESLVSAPELTAPAALLAWMQQAGVLALDPDTTRVRFAVQRFADHIRASNLLRLPHPSRKVTPFLKELGGVGDDAHRAERMLNAMAGAAPQAHPGRELTDYLPRRVPLEVTFAVLRSLEGRNPKLVRQAAHRFVLRRIQDPGTAPWAWYSVFVNATHDGHPLGTAFLNEHLSDWGRTRLERQFVRPVLELLDYPDGLRLLRKLMHWAATTQDHTDQVVRDVSTLLIWLSAVPYEGLRNACIRTTADLWTGRSDIAYEHVHRFGDHEDALIAEACWLAAYGALARTAHVPSEPRWDELITRSRHRPHLRIQDTLAAVHEILHSSSATAFPFHELRRPRTFPFPVFQGQLRQLHNLLSWCPFQEESPIPRLTWVMRRCRALAPRAKVHLRRRRYPAGEESWASEVARTKPLISALQEWYAEEAYRHSQTAGPPTPGEWGAARYHQRGTDPTIGAAWQSRRNTQLKRGNWWGVPFTAEEFIGPPLQPPVPVTQVPVVRDRDGQTWFILHGHFHLPGDGIDDAQTDDLPELRAPKWVTSAMDIWRSTSPARKLQPIHPFVEIDAFVVHGGHEKEALRRLRQERYHNTLRYSWPGQAYLAEYYRRPDFANAQEATGAFFFPTTLNYPSTPAAPPIRGRFALPYEHPVPTRRLVESLGLQWSGRRLDFTTPGAEQLALTDPGFDGEGPRALLLDSSATHKLTEDGWTLLWRLHAIHSGEWDLTWTGYCSLKSGKLVDLTAPPLPSGLRGSLDQPWPSGKRSN